MDHETAGDPLSGLKWTRRTTAKVAAELGKLGTDQHIDSERHPTRQLQGFRRVTTRATATDHAGVRGEQRRQVEHLHALAPVHHAIAEGELDTQLPRIGGESIDLGGFRQYVHRRDRERQVELAFELDTGRLSGRVAELLGSARDVVVELAIGERQTSEQSLSSNVRRVSGQEDGVRLERFVIQVDGRLLLSMSARHDGQLRLDRLDRDHPGFRDVFQAILTVGTTTQQIQDDDLERLGEVLDGVVPGITAEYPCVKRAGSRGEVGEPGSPARFGKGRFWRVWRTGCSSISGLLVQDLRLPAPMESADPHLIRSTGFVPRGPFRFSGSRSDLFAITPCRTLRNLQRTGQCTHWPDDFVRPQSAPSWRERRVPSAREGPSQPPPPDIRERETSIPFAPLGSRSPRTVSRGRQPAARLLRCAAALRVTAAAERAGSPCGPAGRLAHNPLPANATPARRSVVTEHRRQLPNGLPGAGLARDRRETRQAGDRTLIDIKLPSSSMPRGTRRFPHGAYSGPVDPGASLPGPHRAENEPPTQGDNQLVSTSVLSASRYTRQPSIREQRGSFGQSARGSFPDAFQTECAFWCVG